MKFISKYSNNKEVSAAQFITELICERKAIKDKEDLHFRFWTSKKWAKFFRDQIATANKLVKAHNPIAIIKALNEPKGKTIYSLRAPFLKDIIVQQETILENSNKLFTKTLDRTKDINHQRPNKKHKNILSKLEDLENDS
jgi:hypothetical protein